MKKTFLLVLAVVTMLFVLSGVSGATVLDFEGLTANQADPLTAGYGGFNWDNGWYLYNDTAYPNPAHSGHYGIVNNYGTNPLGLEVTSNTAFDFNGAWISGWYFNAPQQIKAQGFDQFDNLVAETAWMSIGISVNSYLQADFADVYRVNFVGGHFFTIDDFTFNESQNPVPEPATLFLIGSGIVGLLGARRKKKQ